MSASLWFLSPVISALKSLSSFSIHLIFLTTINGQNLCGEMFDNYIEGTYLLERFIPVIIIGLSISTTIVGVVFLNRNKKEIQ